MSGEKMSERMLAAEMLTGALAGIGLATKVIEHGMAVNVWLDATGIGDPDAQVWLPIEGSPDTYVWGDSWQYDIPRSAGPAAAAHKIRETISR